jgi:hypothetical protein
MKKLIALLLALAVVGVAFAQDAAPVLKFSGYLNTGFAYAKTGSADDQVAQNGDDSATTGRININASYTNGDYGVNFRIRQQPAGGFSNNTANMTSLFMRRVYGWTNLFGGMAKVQAGRLGDYSWSGANGTYWNSFGNFDGPVGVQLQVKAVDGLNFGIFVPIAQTTVPTTLQNTFKASALGLNYTMKDTFNFQAGYQMNAVDSKLANLWFGGQVLAVAKVTADFEGQFTALGNKTTGSFFVFEKVGYDMSPIVVSAQMSQEMFNVSGTKAQIYIGPEVDYALDANTTLGANVDIAIGDKTGYGVSPWAKFVTNKNSFIKVGFGYSGGDVMPSATVFKTPGVWAARTDATTSFLVDFVWNF